MARITTVIACSHSPFLFQPIEWWNATRDARPPSSEKTVDDNQENARKHQRTDKAFDKLREIFQAAKPDVMVVFGDDQNEQFDLHNFPAFAIYVGGQFAGYKEVAYAGVPGAPSSRTTKPKTPEHWTEVKAEPELAKSLLTGLIDAGIDPAFMMALPKEEHGMGHAFMRPTGKITGGRFDVPMVPVLVNCYYAPQPRAARCVAAARAIRSVIESWPQEINVAVVGSGGLWHVPGTPDAYIDEEFDNTILEYLRAGDADGMAAYFDTWQPKPERRHLRCYEAFSGGTGMPGGLGSGTGETRTWIMAAAVADRPGKVIDYVPVYASPCGMGFAHWEMVAV